jgi:hypothetical protein
MTADTKAMGLMVLCIVVLSTVGDAWHWPFGVTTLASGLLGALYFAATVRRVPTRTEWLLFTVWILVSVLISAGQH